MEETDDRNYQSGSQEIDSAKSDRRRLDDDEMV